MAEEGDRQVTDDPVATAVRERWLEVAHRRFSGTGRRAGAVRIALLELFAAEGQCLVTAGDVIRRLDEQGIGSPASVYRLLDELFALGLLHRVDGRDGTARYEIADPEHHHHHLVDARTGEVHPFTDDALERAIAGVAERYGFRLERHDIILRGVKVQPGRPEPLAAESGE